MYSVGFWIYPHPSANSSKLYIFSNVGMFGNLLYFYTLNPSPILSAVSYTIVMNWHSNSTKQCFPVLIKYKLRTTTPFLLENKCSQKSPEYSIILNSVQLTLPRTDIILNCDVCVIYSIFTCVV